MAYLSSSPGLTLLCMLTYWVGTCPPASSFFSSWTHQKPILRSLGFRFEFDSIISPSLDLHFGLFFHLSTSPCTQTTSNSTQSLNLLEFMDDTTLTGLNSTCRVFSVWCPTAVKKTMELSTKTAKMIVGFTKVPPLRIANPLRESSGDTVEFFCFLGAYHHQEFLLRAEHTVKLRV